MNTQLQLPEKKEDEVGIHILTYFKVLLAHWWIIVPCIVLGAALGFVRTRPLPMPPTVILKLSKIRS